MKIRRLREAIDRLEEEYQSIGYRKKLTKKHKVIRSEQERLVQLLSRISPKDAEEISERLGL